MQLLVDCERTDYRKQTADWNPMIQDNFDNKCIQEQSMILMLLPNVLIYTFTSVINLVGIVTETEPF